LALTKLYQKTADQAIQKSTQSKDFAPVHLNQLNDRFRALNRTFAIFLDRERNGISREVKQRIAAGEKTNYYTVLMGLLGTVALILISLWLAHWLSKTLIAQINALTKLAREAGFAIQLDTQNKTWEDNEVGRMEYSVAAFRESIMALHTKEQALKEAYAELCVTSNELSKAHDQLELRVKERTAELAHANEKLHSEIVERQNAENRAQYLALHDALTGLPNRRLFSDRLDNAISLAKRQARKIAVLIIDLDRFKTINDTLGHVIGDEILKRIAHRLKANLRESDTVARLGGDEFVVLLPDTGLVNNVVPVASKLQVALSEVMRINGHELKMTPSIGISLFPDHGGDAEQLLHCADMAMYHVKGHGRDSYRFYDSAMNSNIKEMSRLELALHKALANQELKIYYQPRIDIADHRICSFEALLRWQHPEDGLIRPDIFIPIAEETGLIVPIGDWVLHEACKQLARWDSEGRNIDSISVNLSTRQFSDPQLLGRVKHALQQSGLDASRLDLEVTESIMLQNTAQTLETFNSLKQLGIKLSLDDFGTGYSSLSYLTRFRVDNLKIDRSFVRDIGKDDEVEVVIKSIIHLAKSLHLRIVAEGVETQQQLKFLSASGCEEVQGYLFSPPKPVADTLFNVDHVASAKPLDKRVALEIVGGTAANIT
ncbi:MAG: EAL domain-containing protein, partial [Betaproteobacteria bacterium]|nr:EAL domain-containing protein [Betaproteobacteria bacterium]